MAAASAKKVTLVSMNDDWYGLYIDGKIVMQDHALSVQEVLRALKIKFEYKECDSEWSEDKGDLPDELDEVEFDGEDKGDI